MRCASSVVARPGARRATSDKMTQMSLARYVVRYVASPTSLVMLVVPMSLVLYRTFRPGFHQFYAWITTPAAISALQLSLLVVAIVIPLNVIFGVATAMLLARNRFPGKGCAAGDRRSAVRGVAHHCRRGNDLGVGFGWGAGLHRARHRNQDHLRRPRHRAGQPLRYAAVRRARGSTGAAAKWVPSRSRLRQRWVRPGGRRFGG